MTLTPASLRLGPADTKVAAMEKRLRSEGVKKGLTGDRLEAYIYGTLNKMGYKRGSKTTRKGAAKAKRTDAARSKPCGESHIPAGHTCHKKGSFTARKAIAVGLGVAALGAGAYALSRRKSRNQAAAQRSERPSASGGQPSPPFATPAVRTTSNAPVRAKINTTELTKKQKAQTTSTKQAAPRERPQSVFAAFKKHALETEDAKPILWDKKNNFLIAENTVGTKYGYTLTPEGMWVSLKVGGISDEVDFQMRAYNNKVPTQLSEESAKATFNRLSKMFLEATKDKKPDTFLWTQTARGRDMQTSRSTQLGTNTLTLGKDPENARTKFYKALGFEFDPESGEVGRTLGDVRTYLAASNRNRLTRGDSIQAVALTPTSVRRDATRSKPCGASHIPASHTCHKRGGGPTPKRVALAAGLVAAGVGTGIIGIGAVKYARRRKRTQMGPVRVAPPPRSSRSGSPRLPGTPEPNYPRLPGITPKGLLPPARKRKSKTQRMRENTAAAVTAAEQRIAQTAKEEVRRLGQIGNTMAAAGEAAGNVAKTTTREVRLRTEAARRRFEPGYRRPDQKRLPESELLTPLALMAFPDLMPTTIKAPVSRRRKPRGFGRQDATGGPVMVSSKTDLWATGFDAEDGKKYTKTVTNPKTGRKNKVRYGAKGYTIAPGTDKGDRYCARSFGDMKSHSKDCSGKDRNTPLCLSRAKWRCSGKVSRRDGLTPGVLLP